MVSKKKCLSALVAFSLFLVPCFANGAAEQKSDAKTKGADEKITLTCFAATRPQVDDFNDNDMTRWVEEQTGYDLNFIVVNANESLSKLNLLLSTGDYPDIIIGYDLSLDLQSLYGSQKILIPLNDLIEKYGPNTQKIFKEFPQVKDEYTLTDGNIYNLPIINDCMHMQCPQKMWINKTWLKNLGLDMPTTTEEYYQVLKAFKEDDPNGNGLHDEIPLAGNIKGWHTEVEGFLMSPFLYCGVVQQIPYSYIKDGSVTFSFMQDEWKEGLKYMQKLNKEGLLASESFTQDKQGLKQMGENPHVEILGCFPGGAVSEGITAAGSRYADYAPLPPLTGPKGVRYTQYDPYSLAQSGFSITDKCEHPVDAMKLADFLYSDDASMFNMYGREGKEWEKVDDPNAVGLDGGSATWRKMVEFDGRENNVNWRQEGPALFSAKIRRSAVCTDLNSFEAVLYSTTINDYKPCTPDISMVTPPMIFSEEQSSEYLPLFSSIQSYAEEFLAKSVTSDMDIDANWPSYVKRMKNMGYDKVIDILNEVYAVSK